MSVKQVQAIINGQTYTLTLNNDTGKYETTITAPQKSSYPLEGHYYPVTVKATDDAGNVTTVDAKDGTLGTSLQLKVKEKVAPTVTITYPTASAVITNNKPTIKFKVTDDDSGVNPATIGVTIDSGSKVTGDKIVKSQVSGGYECSYVPKQHYRMEVIQSKSMHLTLMKMQLHRNRLRLRLIRFRLHLALPVQKKEW